MTNEQFQMQMRRLQSAFGENKFDVERLELIWQSVGWMELGAFEIMVSRFIATMRTAPLPKDFKDQALLEKSRRPRLESRIPDQIFAKDGLKKALAMNYPGCHTLADAIHLEREKIKIKRALE